MRHALLTLTLSLLVATLASAQTDCVWGSFDGSRINYAAGPLNGTAHSMLRDIIVANDGSVADGTPELTATYLSDKVVFYTSLLDDPNGALSVAEQAALQTWIENGGTLIVTADNIPGAYETFTEVYGVTNYTLAGHVNTNGNVVAAHAITNGVTTYRYSFEVTFTYGTDALLLGDNGFGGDFMIVMEPETGFDVGGRILVTGDHNLFADSFIIQEDNIQLANNMAAWACAAGPTPVEASTWGSIKAHYR